MPEREQFCTFVLDGYLFGVPVMRVQEVLRAQHLTRVPLAPAVVEGLINLRGQIVTAIDLRRRLGFPPRPDARAPMTVVVQAEDGVVSCLVDEIGDVVEVDADAFEAPPETLRAEARELIPGAYKLHDRLLLLLDVERAVGHAALAG